MSTSESVGISLASEPLGELVRDGEIISGTSCKTSGIAALSIPFNFLLSSFATSRGMPNGKAHGYTTSWDPGEDKIDVSLPIQQQRELHAAPTLIFGYSDAAPPILNMML